MDFEQITARLSMMARKYRALFGAIAGAIIAVIIEGVKLAQDMHRRTRRRIDNLQDQINRLKKQPGIPSTSLNTSIIINAIASVLPYSAATVYTNGQLATYAGFLFQWQSTTPSAAGTAPGTNNSGWVPISTGAGQPTSNTFINNAAALAVILATATVTGPVAHTALVASSNLGVSGTASLLHQSVGDVSTVAKHRVRLVAGASATATGAQVTVTFPTPIQQTPMLLLSLQAGLAAPALFITPVVNASGQCTGYTINAGVAPTATLTYDFQVEISPPPQ